MRQLQIVWILVALCVGLINQVKAESLGEKIGEVAAHLYSAAITNATGSTRAQAQAAAWDNTILAESKQPTNTVGATFQNKQSNTYDAVKAVFSVDGQTVQTKQTIGVWTLTLPKQDTEGKSNAEVATLVTSLASVYLNNFTNRNFSYQGIYDGVKVFALSIDPGHESGDWRDLVWAIVDGTNVRYSCIKRQVSLSALRISADPSANTTWFDIVDCGTKKKNP